MFIRYCFYNMHRKHIIRIGLFQLKPPISNTQTHFQKVSFLNSIQDGGH